MKDKKIELNILTFILIEAFFLLFFFKASFLNIILGTILGILLIFITNKIKINKIVSLVILIISIFLTITILHNVTNFITYNLLNNYPTLIITITFSFVSIFLAFKGYHTYIKSLEITFYFFLFIKLFSFFLLLPNIDINNFNYQLLAQVKINTSFIYIALVIMFINLSIKYLTNNRINNNTFILSMLNPIIMKLITIAIIGTTLYNLYKYPYFNILKKIKYLEFIERMEGILSFEYLVCFIFLTSFCILQIKTIAINIIKNKTSHS